MNFCWRITKYNPQYRDSFGIFLLNEWTAYSDIGRIFDSEFFTYEKYVRVENLYIDAIKYFMNCHNIATFQIIDLEKPKIMDLDFYDSKEMINLFNTVKNNEWLTKDSIENFCRLILRDKLWCKLINNKKIFVHFGWDFYMYIGSSSPCINAISAIQKSNLFVEPFKSPYHIL